MQYLQLTDGVSQCDETRDPTDCERARENVHDCKIDINSQALGFAMAVVGPWGEQYKPSRGQPPILTQTRLANTGGGQLSLVFRVQ